MTTTALRFDVYQRFVIELQFVDGHWQAYRVTDGWKRREFDLVIPSNLSPAKFSVYIDDMFHELARPGGTVERIA